MSPGDEIFSIFDWYPYSLPEPIVVDPETSGIYLTLELHTRTEDWDLYNPLIQGT